MPKVYKLKKAAESINKDYKHMEKYVPEMNKAISGNSEPVYDPRQSVQDAAYDAGRKFGDRMRMHENVFLWTDKKDAQEKQEKYEVFSDKANQELQDYSARYTNHSARKRAGSSAKAKSRYKKYNLKMAQLSERAEALDNMDNADFKEVKKFFQESMSALDIRSEAMKAAAEVKSTSKADEAFRKAKITRLIISQKLKLVDKYYDKYSERRETSELEEFFREQRDKLQDKMVLCLEEYKVSYLAARGSVDRIKLEEVQPEAAEQLDVKNDITTVRVHVNEIRRQFGRPGTDTWRNQEQNHICKNKNLNSVRAALEEVSQQGNNKYSEQLGKISNLGRSNSKIVTLKKHSAKGHSYSRNDETVFRFDLLGTGGSVDLKEEDIPNRIQNFINMLTVEALGGDQGAERKEYFAWLKDVMHHEFAANIDPNDDETYYDAGFRERAYQFADQNRQLVADFFSYKLYGKKNEDQSLEDVNRGIRVRQAERNVSESRKELHEGQVRELITIQGCEELFGGGKFSIEAAAGYIKELAKIRLVKLFDSWQKGTAEPKTVRFMMDGVSRGGVNAGLGAMAINGWVAEEYPQFLKYIKYDLIQREPVPGPSTATAKDSIRIGGAARDQQLDANGCIKGTKYKPLPKSAVNSTVFYSFHPNVGIASPFFQPQRVYGANRIILSPFEHADDGAISGVFNDLMRSSEKSRPMLNNSNGEFYAGSGVSDLEDGVYILDEYSTLTKINSYEDAVAIFNKTRKDTVYSRRKARILEVVKDWFIEHKEMQGGNVENER